MAALSNILTAWTAILYSVTLRAGAIEMLVSIRTVSVGAAQSLMTVMNTFPMGWAWTMPQVRRLAMHDSKREIEEEGFVVDAGSMTLQDSLGNLVSLILLCLSQRNNFRFWNIPLTISNQSCIYLVPSVSCPALRVVLCHDSCGTCICVLLVIDSMLVCEVYHLRFCVVLTISPWITHCRWKIQCPWLAERP
jgi:hypothetical protein